MRHMSNIDQNLPLPLASKFGIYLLRGAKPSKGFSEIKICSQPFLVHLGVHLAEREAID